MSTAKTFAHSLGRRITLQAQDKFDIDPDLQSRYVLARVTIADKQLLIFYQDELIRTFDF